MTPGARGADRSGECACRCLRYVLVEACGKRGPESTRSPTAWGADRAQEERQTEKDRAGPTSLCRPMRKKNVKPTSPEKYMAQGPGWGPRLNSHNETTPGALEKPPPLPLGGNGCLDWGSQLPLLWQGGLGSLSLGKEEQHLRVGWGFSPPSPPQPSAPRGKDTDSSVGGWGRAGSPNPGGVPSYTRREQGSPHRGQAEGQGRTGRATPKPQ